ncbi:hypothetical protein CCACVL1_24834 [Corchorus capsularis]|uniref:Uncharacterized protein n=1 Tax=Corchorus capsularis TaxID=210143 RepID=A0A1R3GMT6_COCAP|nr:hypothetical protein CCACVL1_24834 [Corchorus capsularis]
MEVTRALMEVSLELLDQNREAVIIQKRRTGKG